MRVTSAATLPLPITTARCADRSNSSVAVVRVAVVPGDELGRRPAARAGPRRGSRATCRSARRWRRSPPCSGASARRARRRRRPRRCRGSGSRARSVWRSNVSSQALDLLVVGGHAAAQQPPRRGQPLEQVDLRVAAGAQQAGGGERPGRARRRRSPPAVACRPSRGRALGGAPLGEELRVELRARTRTSRASRSRRRSRRPGRPRRRRRSRCRPRGRCRAAPRSRSRAPPASDGCSRRGRPRCRSRP